MTVGEALGAATRRLAYAGVPTPAVDARWLLLHVTGWNAARLRTEAGRELPPDAQAELDALVTRRQAREPLQLLVGSVGFRHLEIAVRPDVFIPRPETEVLAGEAIDRVPPGGIVVEPCTGTGAVACAVSSESAAARVLASDLSAASVDLARANADRCGVAVDVRLGDLLAPLPPELHGQVDVLVCNPPYVAAAELVGLEPEVVDWDPHDALVSGPSGHEVTDRLISDAATWLRPGGWLLMETAATRAAETAARAGAAGLVDAALVADLAGLDRIVVARCP